VSSSIGEAFARFEIQVMATALRIGTIRRSSGEAVLAGLGWLC
jgi:hypothetical protein